MKYELATVEITAGHNLHTFVNILYNFFLLCFYTNLFLNNFEHHVEIFIPIFVLFWRNACIQQILTGYHVRIQVLTKL